VLINLDGPTIANSFKQNLSTFSFVHQPDIRDINTQLDKLADLIVRRGTRINHSHSTKTDAAVWLWDYFVSHALKSITTNTRGYHNLSEYFKQYTHYENVLFSIDENHRDHVIHSIWVMMIGFYLINNCRPLKLPYSYPFTRVKDLETIPDSLFEAMEIMSGKANVLWTLISLTHDLGYPIQKTIIANDVLSRMISNFGFLEQTDFSYQFTVLHQTAIDELLNTLSTVITWVPGGSYKLGVEPGNRLDYSKSFERLDHGIMSAYLIQRYLDFICDTMSWIRDIPEYVKNDSQEAALKGLIIDWLSAIADHTSDNKYFSSLAGCSELLIISDELDEFSRYAHGRYYDTWVSVVCNPRINCTKQSLIFIYEFIDRTHAETLAFFKSKIFRLIDRFVLSETSLRKISIKCLNSSSEPLDNVGYYFEKRFDTGDGFVKRLYGQQTDDVRGFLIGAINLH